MGNLKYDTMKQKRTHRLRDQTCGCQVGWGGRGMDWEFGTDRCKLLYTEWINNKVLLYSTGNYSQYPVINHNGKNMENNVYIYVCVCICILKSIFTYTGRLWGTYSCFSGICLKTFPYWLYLALQLKISWCICMHLFLNSLVCSINLFDYWSFIVSLDIR